MTAGESEGYRRDIEGLRAVAIVSVVAFHASVPGFSGGFVGVDVFFVISGFLITGILRREAAEHGRVRLIRFWSRRVKRLVPALAVVLALTLVAGVVVYSPLEWKRLALEATVSGLYLSNLFFARQSTQYFAPQVDGSPFLQTWSLGVEEQFYLVWPLIVLVAAALASRRWRFEHVFGAGLATVAVTSFIGSFVLTSLAPSWAFFSSPTRAWEFAVGGCLALFPSLGRAMAPRVRAMLGAAGGLAVVVAVFMLTEHTPYPGVAALLPVLGTAAMIAAGGVGATGVSRALSAKPMGAIGRVSYSWYLLHWPAIVLLVAVVPTAGPAGKVAIALASLLVAELLHRLVENPLRFSPRLSARPSVALLVGGAFTLAVLGGALVVRSAATSELRQERYQALMAARDDYQSYSVGEGCNQSQIIEGVEACVAGDPSGSRTVVLAGDSHAEQWAPALDELARASGVRLLVRTLGSCPAVNVPVIAREGRGVSAECREFTAATRELVDRVRPDGAIVSSAPYRGRVVSDSGQVLDEAASAAAWGAGVEDLARWLDSKGIGFGLILDLPSLPQDPIECLARSADSEDCRFEIEDLSDAWWRAHEVESNALREAGYGTAVDPAPAVCPQGACAAERDAVITFKDSNHLTKTMSRQQAPVVRDLLRQLAGSPQS